MTRVQPRLDRAEQERVDRRSTALGGASATQRIADGRDAERITELMRSSVMWIFPRFYNEVQTASAAVYVAHVDPMLLDDGTNFVDEADGQMVACGGWSRRGLLYTGSTGHQGDDRVLDPEREAAHVRAMFVRADWTRRGLGRAILESSQAAARAEGFTRLDLMATLPGVPLYSAFGFREVRRGDVTMPDGVTLECVAMERPVDPAP